MAVEWVAGWRGMRIQGLDADGRGDFRYGLHYRFHQTCYELHPAFVL